MKKWVILIALVILANSAHSIEITDVQNTFPSDDATISSIQQDVKQIEIRVNDIPNKKEIETSFIQLDQKISSVNQSASFSSLGFMVGVMLLNDILIVGLYIFAKTKGVFP